MPTKSITFKNVALALGNGHELYISAQMWDGALKIGDASIIVNVLNDDGTAKAKSNIIAEAKEMLKAAAEAKLEDNPPVLDLPGTVPDFSLSVTYD